MPDHGLVLQQRGDPADGQRWQVWESASPAKTTWSGLGDVSCAGVASCMTVGAAGTSKQGSKGIVYTGHATVYSWDGGQTFTPLKPPAPKGAKTSELAGVSCWRNTACLAAGNYTNAKGKSLPYSVVWNNGTWQLKPIPQWQGRPPPPSRALPAQARASAWRPATHPAPVHIPSWPVGTTANGPWRRPHR